MPVRRRATSSSNSASGYDTGKQAAEVLGIGRTTLGRWVKAGKLPRPVKSISGMLLFEREAIESMAGKAVSRP